MDTGTDGPLQDAEDHHEPTRGDLQWESQTEAAFLDPSRWWFASTACPLLASTFGPMASAFNICSLVVYWRMHHPPGTLEDVGTPIEDPTWLPAINALSLFFALVANGFLLLNMVSRVKFAIAQPFTVVGYFMASFILIALVIVAQTPALKLQPWSHYAFAQSYFYACFAAAIYFIIACLMVFTVYGAVRGKYEKKFDLTAAQRTLMLQTMSLMAYLLVGAGVFTKLERWNYLDSLYWSDFTLLTIGIGDNFTPKTTAGRALVIPYTFGGIMAVGLIISSIRSLLIERGAAKMQARTTEKRRQLVTHIGDAEKGASWTLRFRKTEEPDYSDLPEKERRRKEFEAMRGIMNRAGKKNKYRSLAISTIAAAILWFIGALVFWFTEFRQGWSYFIALYFSYVSLITLGYGDFQPISNGGKAFFVFWTLLAVPTLTVLFSDLSDTVVKGVSEATNLIGSITITPGDPEYWNRMRKFIHTISYGKLFKRENYSKSGKAEGADSSSGEESTGDGQIADVLASRLTERDKQEIDQFGRDSSLSIEERDQLFYHYLLLKEVQSVLSDSKVSPPKQYTFDEWAYFLLLIDHDENSPENHTTNYNHPKKDDEDAPQVSRIVDHEHKRREWSWLGLRSPLLSQQPEADWILERLLMKLEYDMHFQNRAKTKTSPIVKPLFSMTLARQHATDEDLRAEGLRRRGTGSESEK